jgi:hypothetical protein
MLSGCAARPRGAIVCAAARPAPRANLILGPTPYHAFMAEQFGRTDWPATATGYRIDEVTSFTVSTYDEQAHYDCYGALFRVAETVQTGTQIR